VTQITQSIFIYTVPIQFDENWQLALNTTRIFGFFQKETEREGELGRAKSRG
jgi:hypothetical protein